MTSHAMTVDDVLTRLRTLPIYWQVQLGLCDSSPGVEYCNRSDLCVVSQRRPAGWDCELVDEVILHGPPLLHPGTTRDTLTAEELANRLREFPRRWPVFVGMCNNQKGRCEHEPVHQVQRHVAGKLIENILIHGPLRHHK